MCTVFAVIIRDTVGMDTERSRVIVSDPELDAAFEQLRTQGLTVRLHNRKNAMWHIADGGLYSGYTVSSDELVALKRSNRLNIRGIQDLG